MSLDRNRKVLGSNPVRAYLVVGTCLKSFFELFLVLIIERCLLLNSAYIKKDNLDVFGVFVKRKRFAGGGNRTHALKGDFSLA